MTKKETKYFIADTEDEVLVGDEIEVVLTEEKEGHTRHKMMQFDITEESIPLAIDAGIIEEREVEVETEEDNDLLDFGEDCDLEETIDAIVESQEEFEKKLEIFEEKLKVMKTLVDALYKEKKTASSKMK